MFFRRRARIGTPFFFSLHYAMAARLVIHNVLKVNHRNDFRSWLLDHAAEEKECWVPVVRRQVGSSPGLLYLDAVEEALCFGWIDSTTRRSESGETLQRFSPRRKGSVWSELNKARCERLERLGLMTPAGRAALALAKPFVMLPGVRRALQADAETWANFCRFPELYRRVRVNTVQIAAAKHPALFKMRLGKLVDMTRRGEMFGAWDDDGRLTSPPAPRPEKRRSPQKSSG